MKELKINLEIFNNIYKIFSELSRIFSVPVLIFIAGKFILVITSTFVLIFNVFYSDLEVDNVLPSMIYLSASESIKILIILSSSEVPLLQVK